MPPTILNVTIDSTDAFALASFWGKVMSAPLADDDLPGDPECSISLPTGLHLYFQTVPEPKTTKNRVHICLRPDVPRDEEVARVLAIGATIVDDRRDPPPGEDGGWVVFADPEGNEFCVLRSAAEPHP
ncbi:VOC family protein [Asanoa sp. WMMD1127]|uniref:VOC family protein n=1 Tax=Asanoa sp. WMMD1127 TaxID=3016107 RepID=UPI00241657BD|nr:VOC family protein [Asanoa sp. WMMD1127]MDG4827677.1 VOC family protein [Asanoa sp. WMMD1127]